MGHEAVDLFEAQDSTSRTRKGRQCPGPPLIQLMIVVTLSKRSWQSSFLARVEEFDTSDKKS